MTRRLVLFAREPGREAREKGFSAAAAAQVFEGFARAWIRAAEEAGARVAVAAPAEDVRAWRRRIPGDSVAWIPQRGRSFGDRLREAALAASPSGDPVVFVGGDVPPDPGALLRAFEALEGGARAVLSPAPDGGVSLIALGAADLDVLERISWGGPTVFAELSAQLLRGGRPPVVLDRIPDVDRRSDLRRILRDGLAPASLVRAALALPRVFDTRARRSPRSLRLFGPAGLRAPPARRAA